jgi:hypothetical protein
MLSEQDEEQLHRMLASARQNDVSATLVDTELLRRLLDQLVRERQDATVREYGISTLPAGQPARPPAVTVALDEGISQIKVTQAAAWPWTERANPWFTRGAA